MSRPAIAISIVTLGLFVLAAGLVVEQVLFDAPRPPVPVPSVAAAPRQVERAPRITEGNRTEIAPSRGYIPIPPAPLEDGILGQITDARVSGEDRDAFYLMVEANQRVESGRPRFSALHTTAGPSHRASWGVAQLVIRDHLERLLTLSDEELSTLGITRSEVSRASRPADATIAWYEIVVGSSTAGSRVGLSAGQVGQLRSMAAGGTRRRVVGPFGRQFHETTGLPPDALAEMAETRELTSPEMRAEFRRRYARAAGREWESRSRQGVHISTVVRAMVEEHRGLRRVFELLGGSAHAYTAMGHYLGVGDTNENKYGWHARAVEAALGRDRYERLLILADPVTTRLRELANWQHAIAAVDGVPDLHGVERARMLTRISRCFHGAPGRARGAFFFGGDYSRPVSTTASELEAAVQEYRESRVWSDDRVQTAFEQILVERELVR